MQANVPLWNGPLRLKTPPAAPVQLNRDGSLIEFLLPYPMHIADWSAWDDLLDKVGNIEVRVEKPVVVPIEAAAAGTFSNDAPDLFCTIVRVLVPGNLGWPTIEKDTYRVVESMLQWLRILARQYWLLHGSTGVSAFYRGTIFSSSGTTLSQQNFASYDRTVLVRPLSREIWDSVRSNASAHRSIPVSESILCDALMSIASRDDVKGLVELGLAAEIELTRLLEAVAVNRTDPAAKDFLERKRRRQDKFQWKLEDSSVALGLDDPGKFQIAGGPPNWKDKLILLYKFRGSVAHSGKAVVEESGVTRPITDPEISGFIFAVEALLHWSAAQRRQRSLIEYDSPFSQFSDRPIIGLLTPQGQPGFSGRSGVASWLR